MPLPQSSSRRGWPRAKGGEGIQVIARAGAILRALESEPSGLSLGEIARAVGLPRSTVQRIVQALTVEKLVMAAAPGGHVRLGPALLRLAAGARLDLIHIARPYMEELSAALQETVDLSILAGTEAVFVDHVIAGQRLRLVSDIGVRFPLHSTANGKALLSLLPDDAVVELLDGDVAVDALLNELASVRTSGVAIDREAHTEGICAVGVALVMPARMLAALSVPVPVSRFKGSELLIVEQLKRVCSRLREQVDALAIAPPSGANHQLQGENA